MPIWLVTGFFKAFGWLKEAARAALAFVTRYPWQTALLVALVAVAWLWRANGHLKEGIKTERAAHAQTVANYRTAQKKAEAVQEQNLLRVAQAYTDINERKENALEADRASSDARYRRLLANAESYRGAPRSPDMSAATDAACIAYSGTVCAELPKTLLEAQRNTDQLVALIDWAKSISEVGTSGHD